MSDNGWERLTVSQLGTTASGPFGSNLTSKDYVKEGIPVIRGENLAMGRWITDPFTFVSEDKAKSLRTNTALPGDVIFTQRGTLGQVALVPPHSYPGYVISQSQMRLRPDPSRADATFLYYLFSSQEQQDYIRARTIQTGVPHTNLGFLRQTPLRLPPVHEQRAIASVLGGLDDKIELNRRMSDTLEALARAIFQSWFIDFDPVRARAEGRAPTGVDAEAASMFPSSLVDSPLGSIPAGWDAVRLGWQIEVVRGLSYSGSGLTHADGGGLPMHNLNSIHEGGGYKRDGLKWYMGLYQARRVVTAGDLIVANTEQGFDRRLIGYPALVPSGGGDPSLFSHHLFRVRPRTESRLTAAYLYHLLISRRYHDEVAAYANGTTINMLPNAGLERPWIALPPVGLVRRFGDIVGPMLEQQEGLVAQSQTLADLRDLLLPKLVTGDLRLAG